MQQAKSTHIYINGQFIIIMLREEEGERERERELHLASFAESDTTKSFLKSNRLGFW